MGFAVFSYTSKGTLWKVFTIHLSAATSRLCQQCCCFHLKSGFLAVKHVGLWKQKSPNFLTKIQPTRSPWLFTSHLFKWPRSLRSSGPCKPSSSNPNPEERCSHLLFGIPALLLEGTGVLGEGPLRVAGAPRRCILLVPCGARSSYEQRSWPVWVSFNAPNWGFTILVRSHDVDLAWLFTSESENQI